MDHTPTLFPDLPKSRAIDKILDKFVEVAAVLSTVGVTNRDLATAHFTAFLHAARADGDFALWSAQLAAAARLLRNAAPNPETEN